MSRWIAPRTAAFEPRDTFGINAQGGSLSGLATEMSRSRIVRFLRNGYVVATLTVAAATAVFLPGRENFAKGQWALLYLLIVTVIAGASGTGPAIVAALEAFLAWNFFFLPPFNTLAIRDPKDLLALFAFLIVGVVLGIQTGRMRQQRQMARAREREAALLGRLSAYLVSETSTATMAATVFREAETLVGSRTVMLFIPADGSRWRTYGSGGEVVEPSAAVLTAVRWVARSNKALGIDAVPRPRGWGEDSTTFTMPSGGPDAPPVADGEALIPLHAGAELVGVLFFGRADAPSDQAAAQTRMLVSLGNLIATFLERQRLQNAVARIEAARAADQMKSALLSSVSHELKTPLTALTATLSNMLQSDTAWDEAAVRAELEALVGDVARLNNSITALLDLSRLESREWTPKPDWQELTDILETSVAALPALQQEHVAFALPDSLPFLYVDFEQWTRVFHHLLENAVVYGGPEVRVLVGARTSPADLTVWVEDDGPGVPAGERELIFEKFYRAPSTSRSSPSGTGLGLAIAREIVVASGGTLTYEDAAPHGAKLVVILPASLLRWENHERS